METDSDETIFAPLFNLIGDRCGEYMFMGKHLLRSLAGDVVVFGYKHSTTRQTLYVTASGRFFKCLPVRDHEKGKMEQIEQMSGIRMLIDNAVEYYKEGQIFENMKKQHLIKGEIEND
jgi:hypothetical protein